MPTAQETIHGAKMGFEMGHLFALEALVCCARCLSLETGPEAHQWPIALSAIETVWDVAPLSETSFRRKAESISELYSQIHGPTEQWLPYSNRLEGYGKVPLAINGRLNPGFHDLLAEYLGTSFTCSQE